MVGVEAWCGVRGWRLGQTLATIFVVAVLFNYPWELAQSPLYVGMESFSAVWWHCFVSSLGDGVLVLLIFAAGWVVPLIQMLVLPPLIFRVVAARRQS